MRTVIRCAFWLLSLFLMSEIQAVTPQKEPLKLGAERMDVVTRLLKDKRVGLVVNQTSILEKQQKHLLDALLEEGVDVKKCSLLNTVSAGRPMLVPRSKTAVT